MTTTNTNQIHESVKEYYGQTLKTNEDLQTNACCPSDALPAHLREFVKELHPEVVEKFYGCGSPIPTLLEGKTVLDLGCGSGRDAFVLSRLVGPEGKVIGVDMTAEQLAVAQKHVEYHTKLFGYPKSNIEFLHGYIEDLAALNIETESIDVVVSNCVINLSPSKANVFSEIFRVLKPGGELYFSDIFSGCRLAQELSQDPVLVGECLGGALYIEDFRRLLESLGCRDCRTVSQQEIVPSNSELEQKLGMIPFYSLTLRAFKLELEDRCEDYGQVATYLGTIPQHPHAFPLDDHHLFQKGKPALVCSNTASMLQNTRYAMHFKVDGSLSTHYGLFDCAGNCTSHAGTENKSETEQSCC